jgi:hypothetical protein
MKEGTKRLFGIGLLALGFLAGTPLSPAEAVPITQAQLGQALYHNEVRGGVTNVPDSAQFQGSVQPTPGFHLESPQGVPAHWKWSATTANDYAVPRVSAAATSTALGGGSAQSFLRYEFAISGADGNVDVNIRAMAETASAGGQAKANLYIAEPGVVPFVTAELGLFGADQLYSLNQTYTLVANVIYQVTMQVFVQASLGSSASAYVDPYFSAPAGYTVLTSAGIGNLQPSTVPIPAALPLFASGLGALGLFGWRRKKAAASAG